MHGILVVDKPAGVSSALAVDRVKHALGVRRVGHGGTLDPLATGVLPICLGAATKLAPYLLADDKAYEAEGVLGIETDTLDRTGRITAERPVAVTREAMLAAIAARLGEHDQVPPMYSAIKQGGVRLYHLARAGEEVERASRRVRIDHLELLSFDAPRFRISVACSKGTYIRSLVADLGTDVGAGAHLAELRRTRSGRFTLADAIPLDRVGERGGPVLIAMSQAISLPAVIAPEALMAQVRSGVQFAPELLGAENFEKFQIVAEDGRMLAIAHPAEGKVIYDRVFGEVFGP